MKTSPILISIFALILTLLSSSANAKPLAEGDILETRLDQLHPTQLSVGYDQIYYKLARYQKDKKKLFDDICQSNGQKGVKHFDQDSVANQAASFVCKKPVGTDRKDMKTIVIAPNGQYYLTDGHHTFNTFWQMKNGGPSFTLSVVIAKDYRALPSMKDFWQAMQRDGNLWLQDNTGKMRSYQSLPHSLGLTHFEDDQYRSFMYFSRDVSWKKPNTPIPFLEFYWANVLRKAITLHDYDLTSLQGYKTAFSDFNNRLQSLRSSNIGGSGKSAKAMGQLAIVNNKAFDKLFKPQKGKIVLLLEYKKTLALKK